MTLFGVGKMIFGHLLLGSGLLALALLTGGVIYWDLNRRGWKAISD